MWREKVVKEAKSWLNTPYHSGARVKGTGVDCGQFLIGVYEAVGMVKKGECSPGSYSNEWHLHRSEEKYLSWIEKYCEKIDGNPLPGDIAVFKFGRCVSHAGIILEWPRIIHAYVLYGVIISDINEAILCHNNGDSRLYALYTPRGGGAISGRLV